jgi:hypothetical protein
MPVSAAATLIVRYGSVNPSASSAIAGTVDIATSSATLSVVRIMTVVATLARAWRSAVWRRQLQQDRTHISRTMLSGLPHTVLLFADLFTVSHPIVELLRSRRCSSSAPPPSTASEKRSLRVTPQRIRSVADEPADRSSERTRSGLLLPPLIVKRR